jgi:hypothetical protein
MLRTQRFLISLEATESCRSEPQHFVVFWCDSKCLVTDVDHPLKLFSHQKLFRALSQL